MFNQQNPQIFTPSKYTLYTVYMNLHVHGSTSFSNAHKQTKIMYLSQCYSRSLPHQGKNYTSNKNYLIFSY